MKVAASPAALALKHGVEPIQAVINWTVRCRRFRRPSTDEACKLGIGIKYPHGTEVVRDEGLIIVRASDEIHAFTLAEKGIC